MNTDMKDELDITLSRLAAATSLLEQTLHSMVQRQSAFAENAEAGIGRIVATVETRRETELEEKLVLAEGKIAELQARRAADFPAYGRRTVPAPLTSLLAKQGVNVDSLEAGALDAALVSLSLEQRIAVKAQLMRAGLIG
jgi:hypothetical protein